MAKDKNNSLQENKFPPAETGNASNPAADDTTGSQSTQLIDKKGEQYLREVANIEDLPDENDQQDMDDTIQSGKA